MLGRAFYERSGRKTFEKHTICAVVPAYNEQERIGLVIKDMPEFVDHVVVVDDGSQDKTTENALLSGDERVIVLRHEQNQGVGGAIITGHKKSMELGSEVSVVMAGDAQMDPKYLPTLLNMVIKEGFDYAKGNRLSSFGYTRGMPRIRILGNIILTVLSKAASGYWNISDPQNGYTAIRTKTLKELDLDNIAKGYQFENDMLINLNLLNAKVRDVPMKATYRGEISKIKLYRFMFETNMFLVRSFIRRLCKKYISTN